MEASPFHRPLYSAVHPSSQQSMTFAQDSGGASGSAWLCHTWQMATLKPSAPPKVLACHAPAPGLPGALAGHQPAPFLWGWCFVDW